MMTDSLANDVAEGNLLHCPFCGNRAAFYIAGHGPTGAICATAMIGHVECSQCQARSAKQAYDNIPREANQHELDKLAETLRERLTKLWNTRVTTEVQSPPNQTVTNIHLQGFCGLCKHRHPAGGCMILHEHRNQTDKACTKFEEGEYTK